MTIEDETPPHLLVTQGDASRFVELAREAGLDVEVAGEAAHPGSPDLIVVDAHDAAALDACLSRIGHRAAPMASDRRRREALTGLSEPAAARDWLDTHLAADGEVTLLLVAISRFDMINAAFDRTTGDDLLRAVATRIERIARDAGGRETLVARMAGAEFAIGFDARTSPEKARFVADELAAALAGPFTVGEQRVPLACHIGLARPAGGASGASALLRRAGDALLLAQRSDGSPVREANGAGHGEKRLEIDLRRALRRGEIDVVFQPQVAIASGAITGVEALARWSHPELGEIGAATLFAAAERSHYLLPLSRHVQERAVALAAGWPAELEALRLSINVTAADIAAPDFVDAFLAMLDNAGFPRGRVTAEITESGLIDDLGRAAGLFAALRAGGCRVAIDDFGTGFSSLAYLKALPLDYLKIDRQLSADIEGSARDRVVVHGVIEMARSLGLGVIAEGVETEAQLDLLAAEGCTYYQGFLCSEAVDTAGLIRLSNHDFRQSL